MTSHVLFHFFHRLFRLPYKLHVTHDSGRGGRAVVLLHGIGASGLIWDDFLAQINGAHQRVIAVDLLGFGRSTKPADDIYTTALHARSVIKTIRSLGIKSCILVGHSMGGLVAVEVAVRHPDIVDRLICVGMPVYEKDIDRRTGLFARLYKSLLAHAEATYSFVSATIKRSKVSMGLELHPDSFTAFTSSLKRVIIDQHTYKDICRLNLPIKLIVGSFDPFVLQHVYTEAKKHNAQIDVSVVLGSAHTLDARIRKAIQSELLK